MATGSGRQVEGNREEEDEDHQSAENDDEADEAMAVMMGFSSFGRQKAQRAHLSSIAKKVAEEGDKGEDLRSKALGMIEQVKKVPSQVSVEGEESDDDEVGPQPLPPSQRQRDGDDTNDIMNHHRDDNRDDDDDDEKEDSFDDENFIPREYEVDIPVNDTKKSILALSFNPKASRMITGGIDGEVKMWDFNGMTTAMKFFRAFTPLEGHGVQALAYSMTGDGFLCAAGDSVSRIYDVDGKIQQQTVHGDMYIRDMANTKGHTHMVTDLQWHPFDREKFLSSSMDATIRIWDTTAKPYGIDQALPHVHCLKATDKRKATITNCHVTSASWASGAARYIVGGCCDGSLQLWNDKRSFGKSDKVVRPAHAEGTGVTCVKVLSDDVRILSRGEDDTLKLWDVRKFTEPTLTWSGLPSVSHKSSLSVNAAETLVAVACSAQSKETSGSVQFFSLDSSSALGSGGQQAVASFPAAPGVSPIRVEWPDKETRQVFAACSNGIVKCFVDSNKSSKGALLITRSAPAKKSDDFLGYVEPVYTPQSLPPGYKESKSGHIRKVKPRAHEFERTQKTIMPPRPTGKEGAGGQAATQGSMSQFLMGTIDQNVITEQDAAEVLRGYAKVTEEEPIFMPLRYKVTQPKPIFVDPKDLGERDRLLESATVKCSRCGLKLCQCGRPDVKKTRL